MNNDSNKNKRKAEDGATDVASGATTTTTTSADPPPIVEEEDTDELQIQQQQRQRLRNTTTKRSRAGVDVVVLADSLGIRGGHEEEEEPTARASLLLTAAAAIDKPSLRLCPSAAVPPPLVAIAVPRTIRIPTASKNAHKNKIDQKKTVAVAKTSTFPSSALPIGKPLPPAPSLARFVDLPPPPRLYRPQSRQLGRSRYYNVATAAVFVRSTTKAN